MSPRTKATPKFWRTFSRRVQPVTVIKPDGTVEVQSQTFEQVERTVQEGEEGRTCQDCKQARPT